jgi:4'-phosphopantetheinyl transferase
MAFKPNILWPSAAAPDSIGPDELHVWAIELGATVSLSNSVWKLLTPDEQAHAQKFQRDEPRLAFILTRAALRTLLGRLLNSKPQDVPLVTAPSGKLRLTDELTSDLRFNVAHTTGLALVAVTRGAEVGVDVERIRPVKQLDDIAARHFTAVERDAILAAPQRDVTFFSYWTRKEAILKAIGLGLAAPLDSFSLPPPSDEPICIDVPPIESFPGGRIWLQALRPSADHPAALAVVGQTKTVQRWMISH